MARHKRVCKSKPGGKCAAPTKKQVAWRKKFAHAAIACRSGDPHKYASCMRKELK